MRWICLVLMCCAGCVVSGSYVGTSPAYRPGANVSVRVSFFGVPLDGAQDVVFVLDRSGSMSGVTTGFTGQQLGMGETKSLLVGLGLDLANEMTGSHLPTKLETAKAELVRALRAMPDGTRVGVIWFDDDISTPSRHLMILQPHTRAAIERFVSRIETGDTTAAVPALELAYRMGARRVILLSDGLANDGGDGDVLLARARDRMRDGVRFDTVGLGIDQDGAMLQQLANESGGVAIVR